MGNLQSPHTADTAAPREAHRAPALTRLRSFSGLHESRAEVLRPRDREELLAQVDRARRAGRRIVLRGAGLSFDAQALGDDLAVSLDALGGVELDAAAGTFTAGTGATWGEVYARLVPAGLVVPATMTTSLTTVGGTLSANALSRFSPLFGKEGKAVESLEVLTLDGEVRRVSRAQDPELFYAVVGGFGGVAVVLSATYRAHRVGPGARIRSWVERRMGFDGLAEALAPEGGRSAYAVISVDGALARTLVVRSEYCGPCAPRPMLPHRPAHPTRVPIEWAVNRFHGLSAAFWHFTHAVYMRGADRTPFVDDVLGYTFFMDGHMRARRAADRFGVPFRVAQLTLLVPRAQDVAPFLRDAVARLARERLPVTLVDALWLPPDEPVCLSSTRAGGGYACTLSFEGPRDPARLRRALGALSADAESLGGRVHLSKNVMADPALLERTYAEGLARYAAVKRRVDPEARLRTDFLLRCFPSLFAARG